MNKKILNASLLLFFVALSCCKAKQEDKPYFKFIDAKNTTLLTAKYDINGQLISEIKLSFNKKGVFNQFAFVNTCPKKNIISALHYGENYQLVIIKNGDISVIFSTDEPTTEYSFDSNCEKIAVLTMPNSEHVVLNIVDLTSNMLKKYTISQLNEKSGALMNQKAWLSDESILISKLSDGKFAVVKVDSKDGKEKVLASGKGPLAISEENNDEIVYVEQLRRIVSIKKDGTQRKIIKEYPEGFSIGRLHVHPDYNGLIFKLVDQTGSKFFSKYIFLNLESLSETELALQSDDFVPITLTEQ